MTAVCNFVAKQGLLALAMEVGPQVAHYVTGILGKPDRLSQMAALQQQYPSSVAFVDFAHPCAPKDHPRGLSPRRGGSVPGHSI